MDKLAAQYIVDIIGTQMEMPANTVWLRDQNKLIPNDKGLYIVVGLINAPQIITASYKMVQEYTDDPVPEPYQVEYTQVQQRENIQVDVLSRSNDALTRNWEVIAALSSIYSKQVQEANSFKIFRIPQGFINTSDAEGGSFLNRYSITFPVFTWYKKRKVLSTTSKSYYDSFETRVDDENTIGTDAPVFEFEINAEETP